MTIAQTKIKDSFKKYSFLAACLLCLVISFCSIWISNYSIFAYLIVIAALSCFFDVNKMICLCSFSVFFLSLFNFWSETLVYFVSLSVICFKQIVLKEKKLTKDIILPLALSSVVLVLFFVVNFEAQNYRFLARYVLLTLSLTEAYFLRDDFDLLKIIRGLCALFIFSCVFSILFILTNINGVSVFFVDIIDIRRYVGLMGHSNITAMVAVLLITALLQLFIRKKIKNLEFVLWGIPLVAVGVLTRGKLFILLFAVLLVVYLVFLFIRNWKIGLIETFLLLLVGAIIFVAFHNFVLQYLSRFFSYYSDEDLLNSITTGRLTLWKEYSNLWTTNATTIVFGLGGTKTFPIIAAHNEYIETLVRYGLLGFLCIVTLIVYLCYKLQRKSYFNIFNYFLLLVCLIVMTFDPFIQEKFVFILMGVLSIYNKKDEQNKREKSENVIKDEKIKISVVVPVYNCEEYIKKCINSILEQTHKNIELILVDDGSTDASGRICDEFAKKYNKIVVIHQKNAGPAAARNAGLIKATGDVVSFVDSDDYLNPDMYEKMLSKMIQEKSDICIANFNIEKNGKIKPCIETCLESYCKTNDKTYLFNRAKFEEDEKCFKIDKNVPCYLWRMLFKKNIVDGITFKKDVKIMEDLLFFLEAVKRENVKISHVNSYLYNYLIRGDSAMRQKRPILDSHMSFIKHLEKVLEPGQEDILKHFKFTLYADCLLRNKVFGINDDLLLIKDWATKENYKISRKYTYGFKLRLRNAVIYHKWFVLLKILSKIYLSTNK